MRTGIVVDAVPSARSLIIRDLVFPMRIGVADDEKMRRQRVRINAEILISGDPQAEDDIAQTVSYSDIIRGIRAIADEGHINLVETFAERITLFILDDPRVLRVKVQVEKPDVIAETSGVGVLLDTSRKNPGNF